MRVKETSMFLKFNSEYHEVFIDSTNIESFGRYQSPTVAVAQPSNGGMWALASTPIKSLTPDYEHWIQMKGYSNSDHGNPGRIKCSATEYQQVVELLAPGGAELYDPGNVRLDSDKPNSTSGHSSSVADVAESSREAQDTNTKSS